MKEYDVIITAGFTIQARSKKDAESKARAYFTEFHNIHDIEIEEV